MVNAKTKLDAARDEPRHDLAQPREERCGGDDHPEQAHPQRGAVDLPRRPPFSDRGGGHRLLRLDRHREAEREPREDRRDPEGDEEPARVYPGNDDQAGRERQQRAEITERAAEVAELWASHGNTVQVRAAAGPRGRRSSRLSADRWGDGSNVSRIRRRRIALGPHTRPQYCNSFQVRLAKGRKPVPTAIRLLEGNVGHHPLRENEPKPKPVAPKCPSWLSPIAKRQWRFLAPELEALGLLTTLDGGALAGLCDAFAQFREATEFLFRHGPVYRRGELLKTTTQVHVARAAFATYLKLAGEFGLALFARTPISTAPADDDDEDDILDRPLHLDR